MKRLSKDCGAQVILKAIILGALLTITGCASTGTAPNQSAPPASTQTQPPVATGTGPTVTAPTGDMGAIVFFRENRFVGGAISFKVREGDKELGTLSSGSYFVAQVLTGAHAYTVHSEAKDTLNLEVERGETYYIQGSISMGVLVGRPNLAPSDAATFDGMKSKLKDSAARRK